MKSTNLILNILIVILCILLIFNYIRAASGGSILTFEGLLTNLSNVYAFPIPTLSNLTITADWGLFNFARDFINLFTGIMRFGVFITLTFVNAIMIIFQVLPMLLLPT